MSSIASFANLTSYSRQKTLQVLVGDVSLGGDAPIRVQSMTTTDTNNVEESLAQTVRIIEAGADIVRLTTQGVREAESVGTLKRSLLSRGINTPIVADVHFNPSAAITAAALVDKVRINPGNFTGEAKRFDESADKFDDDSWRSVIISKLRPLVDVCKRHGTALRIGVNHGSLSDRIMAKYGDTQEGMVASCIEYLDALESLDFRAIVISVKSSNTRVMVQTVRLLAATLVSRGTPYPLHLGVTEAGSDAEGRIKSAAGIGALLADGIGDTIRVSLTEAPEAEVPVARLLVSHVSRLVTAKPLPSLSTAAEKSYSPFAYVRRPTMAVSCIGGGNCPVVVSQRPTSIADFILSRKSMSQAASGISFDRIGVGAPMSTSDAPILVDISIDSLKPDFLASLRQCSNVVLLASAHTENVTAEFRAIALELSAARVMAPLILAAHYDVADETEFQVKMSADLGLLFIDGLADGLCVSCPQQTADSVANAVLQLLQATRSRFSKAEFISCPACGRTLYDIQSTVKLIKQRLGHLSTLKIGVMGCIVNGIGEMADADYGYVGAGPGRISLYRGRELVQRSVPQEEALDRLMQIIKDDGLWHDA